MGNYRITDFDGFNFQGAGVYTKSGTVGYLKARLDIPHPPHSEPLNPYVTSSAPLTYKPIETNCLFVGDPDDVNIIVEAIEDKVGEYGILTGKAGTQGANCYAYCSDIKGNWSGMFKDGETQWLHITIEFQPMTQWT